MATIGKLAVILSANSTALSSGLARAGKSLSSFAATAASVATGMVTADLVMGGARSFVNYASTVFSAADAAGDLADRLSVSVTALGQLQHAAEMTDVSQEALTTGLEKFVKSMANTGKSTDDLLGSFGELADQIKATDNIVDQSAILTAHGIKGLELLPLLRLGSEGLRKMGQEARELGVALNATDVAKIGEADTAIKRMHASMRGVATIVVGTVSPAITAVARLITNTFKALQPFFRAVQDMIAPIIDGLSSMVKDFSPDDVINALEPMAKAVAGFADVVVNVGKNILAEFIAPMLSSLATFAASIAPIFQAIGRGIMTQVIAPIKEAMKELGSFREMMMALGLIRETGQPGIPALTPAMPMADAMDHFRAGTLPTPLDGGGFSLPELPGIDLSGLEALGKVLRGLQGGESNLVGAVADFFNSVRNKVQGEITGPPDNPFKNVLDFNNFDAGISFGSFFDELRGAIPESLSNRDALPNALIAGSADLASKLNQRTFGENNPVVKGLNDLNKKQEQANKDLDEIATILNERLGGVLA